MLNEVRYHKQVPVDLRKAISWYSDISIELANRFRESVDDAINQIREYPYLYAEIFEDKRVVRTDTFPYLIFYSVREDTTVVLAVLHNASDPVEWQNRR